METHSDLSASSTASQGGAAGLHGRQAVQTEGGTHTLSSQSSRIGNDRFNLCVWVAGEHGGTRKARCWSISSQSFPKLWGAGQAAGGKTSLGSQCKAQWFALTVSMGPLR